MKSVNNDFMLQLYFHSLMGAYLKRYSVSKTAGYTDMRIPLIWIQNCLKYDTVIYTDKGFKKLEELPTTFKVLSHNFQIDKDEWKDAVKIDSGEKELYEIELDNGEIIKATEDHVLYLENGKEVKVKDLVVGDDLYTLKTFQGKYYKTDEWRENNKKHCLRNNNTPDIVKKIKNKSKERWQNKQWREKELKNRKTLVIKGNYKRFPNGSTKKGKKLEEYLGKERAEILKNMYRENMINGHAAKMNSYIDTPSKNQKKLYEMIKEKYNDSQMNYPFMLKKGKWISMDICIPSKEICIEHDGDDHNETKIKNKDIERDKLLVNKGWKVLRVKDCEVRDFEVNSIEN